MDIDDRSPVPHSPKASADRDGVPVPLPRLRSPLVGRQRELSSVRALLLRDDVPLVTLTGPGGVGKTRLALQVAAAVEPDFADGVCFVELAAVRDHQLVLPTVARALGVSDEGVRSLLDQLAAHLQPRRLLLVVDNLEHLLDAAPVLAHLLTRCRNLTVLATSRVVLRLSGEHDIPVAPLPVPEAVQLFAARARAATLSFALTADNAATIAAICARLDGLPLAIELAAARILALPPAALLARLDPALPLLTGGSRDHPDRFQTMHAAIDWSYDLLDPDEQRLLGRLSAFVGGFTLGAVEAVAGEDDEGTRPSPDPTSLSSPSVLDGVSALVEASLVRRDEASVGPDPRYQMFETIREFGLERLEARDEAGTVRRAHAGYFARLAARAESELTGSDQLVWFERLEAEHANLRAALAWTIEHDPEAAVRMAGSLIRFWDHRSHLREGQRWLEAALAAGGSTSDAAAAKALWGAGVLALMQLDYDAAERLLAEGLERARTGGDLYHAGFALNGLGSVALHRDQYPRARELHEEGLALLRDVGDTDGVAALLGNLGYGAFLEHDYARAVERSEESLALYRELKSDHGMASMLGNLGRAVLEQGDAARAQRLLQEGLALGQRIGNQWYVAVCLEGLATTACARGAFQQAVRLFGALASLSESGDVALPSSDHEINERYLAAARTSLSQAAFDAAWDQGRAMPVDEAIAEALSVSEPKKAADPRPPVPGLTPRETEVLRLLSRGLSDRDIADALFISPRTVNFHVTNLLTKLDVTSRTAAATYAVRHGLE